MTHLTGILAEIAEATDVKTAEKVALRFGGHTVKLPARPRPSSPIVQAVGMEAAVKIVDWIGHGVHTIPMAHLAGPAARRREAARIFAKGGSASEAARGAGVHERTAWRVKKRLGEDALPLFPVPEKIDTDTDSGGG